MSLRPLHDRVIVKRLDQETTTASGIVIPDSAAEKPDQGEVIAVGPGRKDTDGQRIVPDLQVGERVLFGKYAGKPSRWTATSFSCCAKKTSSRSSINNGAQSWQRRKSFSATSHGRS